jgi:hypothetical protein
MFNGRMYIYTVDFVDATDGYFEDILIILGPGNGKPSQELTAIDD